MRARNGRRSSSGCGSRRRSARWEAWCVAAFAAAVLAGCGATAREEGSAARTSTPDGPAAEGIAKVDPLERRYALGETLRYAMTGAHENPARTTRYTAECEGVVRQREDGAFYEETRWTRLEVDGAAVELDEASAAFRQHVSLDPRFEMPVPDVSAVSPRLIGPIFDLMTFYVDAHPSLREGRLAAAGDRAFVAHGSPNSWADGQFVVIGEDCIDFDLTLVEVGEASARLRVRHVPPGASSVRLPAIWMLEPVGDAPNNWVQVTRDGSGGFQASVGAESFDVDLSIARPSGRIERATMDNPVDLVTRSCKDETLGDCGDRVRSRIRRLIELRALAGSG
jgi:hypothetical protein